MSSVSLYRKWRPQTFDSLKGQDVIRDTLLYALNNGQMSQAYLFCGPRGTGKTTTARLVAKLVNCTAPTGDKPCNTCESCLTITAGSNLDVIELDAASNRGIDEIRSLRDTVRFAPTQARYKVFIIDEVHMLTREAFNALLKTLEEPPSHAVFILATTEAHKIPATIISRTQRYDFRPASLEILTNHLLEVAKAEGMKLSPDGAAFVARLGDGSFRDSLSLLDQVRASNLPEYNQETVEKLFGYIPREQVIKVVEAVLSGDTKSAYQGIDVALAQGADLRAFGDQLLQLSQEALEAAILGVSGPLKASFSPKLLVEWIELLADGLQQLKSAPIPRLPIEVAIAKCSSKRSEPNSVILSAPASAGKSKDLVPVATLPPPQEITTVQPASAPEVEPVAPLVETVTVPVLAEVPEHISATDWQNMLVAIKTEAPSLLTSLAHARVLKVEHDVITLAVPYKMHAEKLNMPKHRATVEAAMLEVLGVPMKLVAEVVKDLPKESTDDDMVDVSEVFQLEDL